MRGEASPFTQPTIPLSIDVGMGMSEVTDPSVRLPFTKEVLHVAKQGRRHLRVVYPSTRDNMTVVGGRGRMQPLA